MSRPTPLREAVDAHNPLVPQLGQIVAVPTPSGLRYARVHRANDATCGLTFLSEQDSAAVVTALVGSLSRWQRAKMRARRLWRRS